MRFNFTVVLLSCTLCNSVLATGNDINTGPQPRGSLGQIGNKVYEFARWTGNWMESKEYCEASGMRLASIERTEELKFLESKFEEYVFWGWHWTAARDAHSPKQFVWDQNEADIAVPINWFSNGSLDTLPSDQFMTCGTFHINAVNESAMGLTDCNS